MAKFTLKKVSSYRVELKTIRKEPIAVFHVDDLYDSELPEINKVINALDIGTEIPVSIVLEDV